MKNIYLLSLSVLFLTAQKASAQSSIPIINNINIGSPTNRVGTIYVNNIDASGNAKIGGTLDVTKRHRSVTSFLTIPDRRPYRLPI